MLKKTKEMSKKCAAKNVKPSGKLNPRMCVGCKKTLHNHFVRHAGLCKRWTGWVYLDKQYQVLTEESKCPN